MEPQREPSSVRPHQGGLIHTYLGYDPKNFPSPNAPPPDLASAAFEHMLAAGSLDELTDEELARAIRIDPSMIAGLGPSLESMAAMLRERKRRILETYETAQAQAESERFAREARQEVKPSKSFRDAFERASRSGQLRDLERLFLKVSDDTSDFAHQLMALITHLADQYQIEQLASKYEFTGHTAMTPPQAIEIKQELEEIDRLLEQIEEAKKSAQLAIIDMDALSEYVDPDQIESLNRLQQQIQDFVRQEAERQGLERSAVGYRLTPHAYKLFQSKLLTMIFDQLQASRSGRHAMSIEGEGPVELTRTRAYEPGDPASSLDMVQSIVNGVVNRAGRDSQSPQVHQHQQQHTHIHRRARITLSLNDLEIHRTRNNPKCATCVLLDMSGSMRHGGQYINVKRMGLALDALVRTEYPGDILRFIELYSLAALRQPSELVSLMPKPVSIFNPVVRLRVNMSDPEFNPARLPQHFTNIQRGLKLARLQLAAQDTPNRQIILITDGLPTAHFEGEMLYLLYPPDPRTAEATLREGHLCQREGITINIILIPSWSQGEDDIRFAHQLSETTKGRVMFSAGKDLDRFVVWDYVSNRRSIIGGR
jgi:uncharacterized protein with von Willebrand factor type A (vWA) domain